MPDVESPGAMPFGLEDRMTPDAFEKFCLAHPDLRLELTSKGEIVIVPPAGLDSAFHESDVGFELMKWARADGRGRVASSNGTFILPSGAVYAPDAAWISYAKLADLTVKDREKFARFVPEFLIEIMSPSDRLTTAKAKMEEWMAGGVTLGWLIHPRKKSVYIYRTGAQPEQRTGIPEIAGEGPVTGFVLPLDSIWAGA